MSPTSCGPSSGSGFASDTPALLVARFLRQNGYAATLAAFMEESSLSAADTDTDGDLNVDSASKSTLDPALTLESLVDAHRKHVASSGFEKADSTPRSLPWSHPAPARASLLPCPAPGANMLRVLAARIDLGNCDTSGGSGSERHKQYVLATTAARRVYVFDIAADPHPALVADWMPADSPVLDWHVLAPRYSLGTCMSGLLFVWANDEAAIVSERRDHRKYVVRAAVAPCEVRGQVSSSDSSEAASAEASTGPRVFYVVTAGWDHRIFAYRLSLPSRSSSSATTSTNPSLSEPIAQLELPTLPEDIHLHCTSEGRTILVLARRDSASLFYYVLPGLTPVGSQTLAPHAGPWVPFHPTSLAASPVDRTVLAVTTSSTPSTRLLIVHMLTPDADIDIDTEAVADADTGITATQAGAQQQVMPDMTAAGISTAADAVALAAQKARRALAKEEACAAAIRAAGSTHAPATAYSTPRAVWRPDGSGVWVTGDDGVVRGVQAGSATVVARLGASDASTSGGGDGDGDGHEVDSKVRDLWAGWLDLNPNRNRDRGTGEREECVLSAGFDRRCILWRV